MDKFESKIKSCGICIYEKAEIIKVTEREDINILGLSAFEEAQKMEVKQVANMIVLGALINNINIVKIESVLKALEDVLPARHHHLIPLNKKALLKGMELAEKEFIH